MAPAHFAYVFERFPSFTQTFCAREVMELQRQGVEPLLFSIHDISDESVKHFPPELAAKVHALPPEKELTALVQRWRNEGLLPQCAVLTLREWGDRPDKARFYEAIYIAQKMRDAGVRHAHTHFAGIGARTCWWLNRLFGHTFSFTGHANDIFVDSALPIRLRHLVRDAAFVATVSDFTARWLKEKFPRQARRIQRVYNGLDLEPIAAATSLIKKDQPPLIASVGRLIEKKGFDDLIRACALLRDRGQPFHCIIAGDGPLEDSLRDQIHLEKLTDQVTLAGPLPQEEIIHMLGRASIFALPCVTEKDGGMDNLPTVIMEAMAASLPCVSTRLAGVPEMVIDGTTGLLTEERQPAAFADALHTLLADPARAAQMGSAGLKRARELFAQEITARSLLEKVVEHGDVSNAENLRALIPNLKRALSVGQWNRWRRALSGHKPPTKSSVFPD